MSRQRSSFRPQSIIALMLLLAGTTAVAGGKVGIYGLRMVPYGVDGEQYSRPGWGFGVHAVVPLPGASNIIAGTAGVEFTNLLSEEETYIDEMTGLRVEQKTDQTYGRLFLGGQVGGHGNGFLRPHAGMSIALVYYLYSIDITVPDDFDRERDIRQNVDQRGRIAFGFDLTFGLDMNFSNNIALDMGVRYLKSVALPQQLGEGTVTIYPQYVQGYLGIGVPFDLFQNP